MASNNPAAPKDRVVMVTRNSDGSPKQSTEDFEIIGDKEFAIRAAAEQLGQLQVSNEDAARAQAQAAEAGGAVPFLTEEEQERVDRHRSLMEAAAAQAASEVEGRHVGEEGSLPLERSVPVETTTTRRGRPRKSAT